MAKINIINILIIKTIMEKTKTFTKDQMVSLYKMLTLITDFEAISEDCQVDILKNISRTSQFAREFEKQKNLLSEKFRTPRFVELESKVKAIQELEATKRTPENNILFEQYNEMSQDAAANKTDQFKGLEKEIKEIRNKEVLARTPENASIFTEYSILLQHLNEKVQNLSIKLLNEEVKVSLFSMSDADFKAFYKAERKSKLIPPIGFTVIYETIVDLK
jgi:hypothetical protein